MTTPSVLVPDPEKRTSWVIDGAFLDFKEPVTVKEAAEHLETIRKLWSYKNA